MIRDQNLLITPKDQATMPTQTCPHCHKELSVTIPASNGQPQCPNCARPVDMPEAGSQANLSDDTSEVAQLATIIPVPDASSDAVTIDPSSSPSSLKAPLQGPIPNVAGYEILSELGRGGMGVVYKAKHLRLNRIVALKMILTGNLASSSDLVRFLAEAEAVAAFQHPNIVQVFDTGHHDNLPYMALEFITGGSLAEKLKSGPMAPMEAAKLVEEIARGMNAAHQAGIVHRDLKPENVLMTEDGRPMVTDFGLAKKVEGGSGLTQTGAIMGTPSYMAPEQAGGEGKRVGPAADVYALGAILYECVTGRPPFQADTVMNTLLQVMDQEPKSLHSWNKHIPADLATICLKCLRKDPLRRYDSAHDLAEDLRCWREGEPITARPVSSLERALKWMKRHPLITGLLTTVVLLIVVGTSAIVWAYEIAVTERENAETRARAESKAKQEAWEAKEFAEAQKKIAEAQKIKAEAEKLRDDWQVYAEKLREAQLDWEADHVGIAHQRLNECNWHFRGWEHDYLWTEFHRNQRTLRGHRRSVECVAFSPDGKFIASGSDDHTVKIWNAKTGREIRTLRGHKDSVCSVAFRPDGKRVVSASKDATLKIWDVATGKEIITLKGHKAKVDGVAYSRDGTRLASGGWDGTLRVWNADTGKLLKTIQGNARQVAFRPDGKQIVSGSIGYDAATQKSFGELRVWDADTGKSLRTLSGHTREVLGVAFSPDGRRIVSASEDKTIKVWDSETGTELLTLRGHTLPVTSVVFLSDGKRLVSGSQDSTIRLWNAITGQLLNVLRGHTDAVLDVAVSADDTRIASSSFDESIKVWHTDKKQEVATLFAGKTRNFAFSPDGKQVALTTWGSSDELTSLRILDTESGTQLFALRGHKHAVVKIVYSPDSSRIASLGETGVVKIWDAKLGKELYSLGNNVATVAFSGYGRKIVTGGGVKSARHGELIIWSARDGTKLLTLKGHTTRVTSVAFNPNGTRIVSGAGTFGMAGEIKVWDALSGREIHTLSTKYTGGRVAFSPDGTRVLQGAPTGVIVWDAISGQQQRTLPGEWIGTFSPDRKRIVTRGLNHAAMVWNIETGEEICALHGHTEGVNQIAFSPDGKRIVSCSEDNSLKIWDSENGQKLLTLREHTSGVRDVVFSPNGKTIYSVGNTHDKTIKIWPAQKRQEVRTIHISQCLGFSPDGHCLVSQAAVGLLEVLDATTGQGVSNLRGHTARVYCPVQFSADCKNIVSAAGGSNESSEIMVWNSDTSEVIQTLKGHTQIVLSVAFSPDRKQVVSSGGKRFFPEPGELKVWNVATGKLVHDLRGHKGCIMTAVFSPDGRRIISGSEDKTVIVWDAKTGQKLQTLQGHKFAVRSVCCSPDGTRIVSAGGANFPSRQAKPHESGELKVWDARTGHEVFPLHGHTYAVSCVVFSRDGKYIASAGDDETIRLWEAATGKELATLRGHRRKVLQVAFSPNGRRVFSRSNDETMKVWLLDLILNGQ